jgi:hypothetical protein
VAQPRLLGGVELDLWQCVALLYSYPGQISKVLVNVYSGFSVMTTKAINISILPEKCLLPTPDLAPTPYTMICIFSRF